MKNKKTVQLAKARTFDRLPNLDPRSRAFAAVALIPHKLIRSYTWSCEAWHDQGTEGACFPAGTFIRMGDGSHKAIEKIRLLDEVVTAEGRAGTVLQTMVKPAKKLVEVKIEGHLIVKCTSEHPFLTERGYVAASELNDSDRVAITSYRAFSDDFIDTWSIVDKNELRLLKEKTITHAGVDSQVTEIPATIEKTGDFGRLIGLYAAEGHTTANKVVWSFGGHELNTLVEHTVSLIRDCFGASGRIQKRPNGSVNVVLYGKHWRKLFEALVPGTTKHGDKRLSGFVTNGSDDFRNGVIDGWLEGDGYERRSEYIGVSVSRNLTLDMQGIASGLNRTVCLRESVPSMNAHAVSRQRRYETVFSLGNGSNRSSPKTESATWRKVKSVTEFDCPTWVYNFHVEGDESYVADGVGVHNCVGFAWSHELTARPAVLPTSETMAREIYRTAQKLDPWPGEEYEGTSVLAGVKAIRQMYGNGFIEEFRWAFGLEDLVRVLGYRGPAVLGINWLEGMWNTDENGFIHATGAVMGGHAILARGVHIVYFPTNKSREWANVDTSRSYVLLRNSWGRSWGVDGDAKISLADLGKLLADQGEACVPVIRGK